MRDVTTAVKQVFDSALCCWLFFQLWKDYQLRWEPSDYGGIKDIRVPAEKVWKPDIVLFNKSVI